MGYIGYKQSIKKIKEIKKLRKNIKAIDILHCILVTMNIVCALYIVSELSMIFIRICGKTGNLLQLALLLQQPPMY